MLVPGSSDRKVTEVAALAELTQLQTIITDYSFLRNKRILVFASNAPEEPGALSAAVSCSMKGCQER